jgi:hypothetical protein
MISNLEEQKSVSVSAKTLSAAASDKSHGKIPSLPNVHVSGKEIVTLFTSSLLPVSIHERWTKDHFIRPVILI